MIETKTHSYDTTKYLVARSMKKRQSTVKHSQYLYNHMNLGYSKCLNVKKGLAVFFQFHHTPQLSAIRETLRKIRKIRDFFAKQTTYHFYSSSIVVTYESNLEEKVKTGSPSVDEFVRVKMVDFAHVLCNKNSIDENYFYGLNRLISYLERLLDENYVFTDVRYLGLK